MSSKNVEKGQKPSLACPDFSKLDGTVSSTSSCSGIKEFCKHQALPPQPPATTSWCPWRTALCACKTEVLTTLQGEMHMGIV